MVLVGVYGGKVEGRVGEGWERAGNYAAGFEWVLAVFATGVGDKSDDILCKWHRDLVRWWMSGSTVLAPLRGPVSSAV